MQPLPYLRHLAGVRAYRDPVAEAALRVRLAAMYGVPERACFPTTTGRAAEYLFLQALGLPQRSPVALQAFTCVAVAAPIMWAGMRPRFVDADEATLSMSIDGLRSAFERDRARAVVLQHSFGIPAPVDRIVPLAREHGAAVLEDCAHALGAEAGGRPVGVAGDAAMLSFGVEKTLWTKFGGALVVTSAELLPAVERAYERLPELSTRATVGWLLYPLLKRGLRRVPPRARRPLSMALTRWHILERELTAGELRGGGGEQPPGRLPGVFAALVLDALRDLPENLAHRAEISRLYAERLREVGWTPPLDNPSLVKFPLVCGSHAQRYALTGIVNQRLSAGATWFRPAIFPRGVDAGALGYDPAACPVAERLADRIVNLPTGSGVTRDAAADLCDALVAASARVTAAA